MLIRFKVVWVSTAVALASVLLLPLSALADVTAISVVLGTDNRVAPPWNPGGATGYGLLVDVVVNDTSGVSDLPSSITLTQSGATTIIVPNSGPGFPSGEEYFLFSQPYGGQTGVYNVNVTTVANGTFTFTTHALDNTIELSTPIGLTFSNNGTTPIFSFDTVLGANEYGYAIFPQNPVNGNPIYAPGACLSPTPSFLVPNGILVPGETYYFRAIASSCDFSSTTEAYQNEWDSRSIAYSSAFSPVPEPSSLVLMSSALPTLLGFAWLRQRKVSKPS